ncbi:MAG: HAD-IA family hydrolase [Chloroflexales bacterium]
MPALIFDCDGVLAETERDGHLPAFNQTFAEFGLPVCWSSDAYAAQLRFSGGKERIASLLSAAFVRATGISDDPAAQAELVADWHRRKTAIFAERVAAGLVAGRPGVRRLIDEALAAGWPLAVASASAESAVHAVLTYVVGPARAARIVVLAGDVVAAKKPAPDIYRLALERIGATPADALAIEDSRQGLLAAVGAGIRCLITPSSYTRAERFDEAALVVSSLGDPGDPLEVHANRSRATPGAFLTLRDLAACLDS